MLLTHSSTADLAHQAGHLFDAILGEAGGLGRLKGWLLSR